MESYQMLRSPLLEADINEISDHFNLEESSDEDEMSR